MAIGDIIVGVDIGSSHIRTIVGEINNFNQIEIMCNTYAKCSGMKKGQIISEDEISETISKTIKDAEEQTNLKISSAYTMIPGKYITIVQNSIVKEVKDKFAGISSKDVASSMMQVRDIEIPENMTIIDVLPEKFVLDNGASVEDPIGNLSSSFTLKAQIILAEKEYIKQAVNIFRKAGLEIDGFVPFALAQRNVVLDTNELNDRILLLDIGAGTTEIGVFNENSFEYTNTIPLGGDSITNDIALVLNISEEEADKLKKQYSLALKSFIDNDTDIILNTYKGNSRSRSIKSSELVEIIEARIEEIFTLVNKDITSKGLKQQINNVVLTGLGISSINKSDMAGKIILNTPVKFATGRGISQVSQEYRTVYSLIKYISTKPFIKDISSNVDVKTEKHLLKDAIEKVKDFFYS